MSQIIKNNSGGGTPIPPTVPESFVTNVNSPAIPIANVLNVFGNQTTANNNNGIYTDGSSGSNTETIFLSNRVTGQVTTPGTNTATTIINFPLGAVAGTYSITGQVTVYDKTIAMGSGYETFGVFTTNGTTAVEVGGVFSSIFEPVVLEPLNVSVTASGNSILIQVFGLVGHTIDWDCFFTYRFVS